MITPSHLRSLTRARFLRDLEQRMRSGELAQLEREIRAVSAAREALSPLDDAPDPHPDDADPAVWACHAAALLQLSAAALAAEVRWLRWAVPVAFVVGVVVGVWV